MIDLFFTGLNDHFRISVGVCLSNVMESILTTVKIRQQFDHAFAFSGVV